jgi:hypothetical protein
MLRFNTVPRAATTESVIFADIGQSTPKLDTISTMAAPNVRMEFST